MKKKKNRAFYSATTAVIAASSLTPLHPAQEALARDIQTEIDSIQNVIAKSVNVRAAEVTWDAEPGATRYRIQTYIQNEQGEFIKDGSVRATILPKYTPKTLKANRVYKFEIIPYSTISKKYLPEKATMSNAITLAPPVVEDNGTTTPTPPATPNVTNVQVVAEGQTANVTWDAVTGATRYRVQMYAQDASGNWEVSGSVRTSSTNSFKSSTLKAGTAYKFEITPYVNYKYVSESAATSNTFTLSETGGNTGNETLPTTPATPSVTNVQVVAEGQTAKVTWGAVTGATRYRVQMYAQDASGNWEVSGSVRTSSTNSFKSSTLKAGIAYKFEITPYVNYKYVTASAATSNTFTLSETGGNTGNETLPTTPATPSVTNVQVVAEGQTANVTWDAVTGATRYRVQMYAQDASGNWEVSGSVRTSSTNSFKSSTLKAGITYKFEITPYVNYKYVTASAATSNTFTLSETGGEIGGGITTPEKVSKVTLTPSSDDDNDITVSWEKFTGANRYSVQVYVRTNNGFETFGTAKIVTTTSLSITDLPGGKTYYVSVTPYVNYKYDSTKQGSSHIFNIAPSIEIEPAEPSTPTNPITNAKVVVDEDNLATLTWDKYPNATRYDVQVFEKNASGAFEKISNSTTSNVTYSKTLKEGKTYQFRIVPYLVGKGYISDAATTTSPLTVEVSKENSTPITNLQATLGTDKKVILTWDAKKNATRYQVHTYILNKATNEYEKQSTPRTTSSATLTTTTLVEGNSYKFEVIPYINLTYNPATAAMSQVITLAEATPAEKVSNVRATANNLNATITWNPFNGATKYQVQAYLKDDTTGNYLKSGSVRTVTTNKLENYTLQDGKTYRFVVTPYVKSFVTASAGSSEPLTAKAQTGTVQKLTNFKAELSGGATAQLSWDKFDNSTRYRVQVFVKATSGEFTAVGSPITTNLTNYNVASVERGKTYRFEITPYVNSQYVSASTTLSNEISIPAIPPINGISNSFNGNTSSLSWNPAAGATRYRIQAYKSTDSTHYESFGFPVITSNSNPTATINNLDFGASYKFEVTPYINGSYVTESAGLSNPFNLAMPKPIALMATSLEYSAHLNWVTIPGVSKYQVVTYIQHANGQSSVVGQPIIATDGDVTVNNLTAGQKYYFELVPFVNGNFNETIKSRSNVIQISQPSVGPGNPGNSGDLFDEVVKNIYASLSYFSDTSIDLSWSKFAGVTQFSVQAYQIYPGGYETSYGPPLIVTGTNVTMSGLQLDTSYKFKITPYLESENILLTDAAADSNIVTTPPPPPPPPTEIFPPITGGGDNGGLSIGTISAQFEGDGTRVSLSWNGSSAFDRYQIEVYARDTGQLVSTRQTGLTSLTLSGLDSSTWYTVIITPRYNGSFNSAYSASRDF